jgi:ribosomal protein L37E
MTSCIQSNVCQRSCGTNSYTTSTKRATNTGYQLQNQH